jgi:7,8-dihydropterin-6-yl-methyl-4-(beta-D-ribofuranosyl)aminobenzene 5'-phosphate synthase
MSIKLTILCENSVEKPSPFGLLGEYGFSCLIETARGNYLFDTGGGQTISNNAERLGVDLSKLDGIILSHGHLDHTGGLKQVLEKAGATTVYGHPDLFSTRFSDHADVPRDISIPWSRTQLEALGAGFQLSTEPMIINSQLITSGTVTRSNVVETGDPKLLALGEQGTNVCDPLEDDLSLFIRSDKGLILLLGCAHAGLMNIMDHAFNVTGEKRIHAIIGGTHLMFSTEAQLKATMDRLAAANVAHIGASHCTGRNGTLALAARFKERFFSATVGASLEV